jgi:hypothetical protein
VFARVSSAKSRNVFVELVLIVLGISIALWFEGLAEDMREDEMASQYLSGLRDDLQTDIESLNSMIRHNQDRLSRLGAVLEQLPGLLEASPEIQAEAIFTPSSYHFFQPANFTYLSMQESGDFRLLPDPEIKRDLLKLMRRYSEIDELQRNFIQALDDGYIPLMMKSFDILEGRLVDTSLPDSTPFRNFYAFALQDTSQRLKVLEYALQQADELLASIDSTISE